MTETLLITGSSGIAAATARLAASRGLQIFIVGNRESECKELCAALPGSAYAVADVADYAAVQKAVAACLKKFGSVAAVFNVAGISGRSLGDGPLHECTPQGWQAMMDIHAAGTFYICKEVIAPLGRGQAKRHDCQHRQRAGALPRTGTFCDARLRGE